MEKYAYFCSRKITLIFMEAVIRQPFNSAQIELLSTLASLNTETDLMELKQAISRFFAERADREMERLWENGTINENTLETWKHEHMRTPYHQNNMARV